MYRHVKKFTDPLMNFDYNDVNLTVKADKEEAKLNRRAKKRFYEKYHYGDYQNEEDVSETVSCTLCRKELANNPTTVRNHMNSRGHNKKLKVWKFKYANFLKEARQNILNAKKPRNKYYRRLLYFREAINFETRV
jgi:ribosomal protein S8E